MVPGWELIVWLLLKVVLNVGTVSKVYNLNFGKGSVDHTKNLVMKVKHTVLAVSERFLPRSQAFVKLFDHLLVKAIVGVYTFNPLAETCLFLD